MNTDRFIQLYNILDDLLRDKYHESSRSVSMINRYINQLEKSSSFALHKRARKLNMIRILRNNLVHEFDFNRENILEISDETIEFLTSEIEELKNPITAYKICTKIDQLFACDKNSALKGVISFMSSHGFTQVPIIENKHLTGVFSPNVIFAYLSKYQFKAKKELIIDDFKEFTPCKNHISEKYAFINRDASLDDVVELFDDSHRENKKLAAIFVSEDGDCEQAILGMIVPTDVIKQI